MSDSDIEEVVISDSEDEIVFEKEVKPKDLEVEYLCKARGTTVRTTARKSYDRQRKRLKRQSIESIEGLVLPDPRHMEESPKKRPPKENSTSIEDINDKTGAETNGGVMPSMPSSAIKSEKNNNSESNSNENSNLLPIDYESNGLVAENRSLLDNIYDKKGSNKMVDNFESFGRIRDRESDEISNIESVVESNSDKNDSNEMPNHFESNGLISEPNDCLESFKQITLDNDKEEVQVIHISIVEPIGEQYDCSYCIATFTDAKLHYFHEKDHLLDLKTKGIPTFVCQYSNCNFKGFTQTELMYHNSTHFGTYFCQRNRCLYKTKSAQLLEIHKQFCRKQKKPIVKRKGFHCYCGESSCG